MKKLNIAHLIDLLIPKDEHVFVTKSAGQILFDGYTDPLLTDAEILEELGINIQGLTSKFGLFFGRNNTWYSSGILNIHTGNKYLSITPMIFIVILIFVLTNFPGANDLSHLGQINSVNNSKTSSSFKGECSKYKGSPELFPPYLDLRRFWGIIQPKFFNPVGRKYRVSQVKLDETKQLFQTENTSGGSET